MSAQDLISRLRAAQKQSDVFMDDLVEAADMIESLQKQRDDLLRTQCDFEMRTHPDGSTNYRCGCNQNMTLLLFLRNELNVAKNNIDEIGERLMVSDYAMIDAKKQRDEVLAALERIATAAGATWCNTDWIAAHAKIAIASVKGGEA